MFDHRITIRGKRYLLRFCNLKARGDCDGPHVKNKQIRVRQTLRGEERLEVIIHEILHAGHWDMSEEAVHEFAVDLARILYRRLGYRDGEEKEDDA